MEILDQIEEETFDDPRERFFLDDLEAEVEESTFVAPEITVTPETQMQEVGDATEASIERGVDWNLLDALQQEVAVNMINPSDVFGVPVGDAIKKTGEFFDIDPKELYKDATGQDWVPETSLRYKVQTGQMTDRKRQEIVRQQSAFSDNLEEEWDQTIEAFSYLIPAAGDAAATIGTHLFTGDVEGLKEDAEVAKDFTLMAVDEIAASLGGTVARPFSSFRERPIDTASWVPISWAVKAPMAAAQGAKIAKLASNGKMISPKAIAQGMTGAKTYYRHTKTGDILRNGAKSAVDAIPLPTFVKRGWMDLYAGTPTPFKELRQRWVRKKNADKLFLEEKVLGPMNQAMKDVDNPYDAAKLYLALAGNAETAGLRKRLVEILRDVEQLKGPKGAGSAQARGELQALREEFKAIRNKVDATDTHYIEWTYDGVPMHTTEFLFDTASEQGYSRLHGYGDKTGSGKKFDELSDPKSAGLTGRQRPRREFDSSKIRYKLKDGAPKVVADNAKRLLDVKRHLFDLGLRQVKARTSRLDEALDPKKIKKDEVLNNSFLAEDMFLATVPNYVPIARMPNNSKTLKAWFDLDDAARNKGTLGMAGATTKRRYKFNKETKELEMDQPRYVDPDKTKVKEGKGPAPDAEEISALLNQLNLDPKKIENLTPKEVKLLSQVEGEFLVRENFVDSLELALPKYHDTVSRYELYDDLVKLNDQMKTGKADSTGNITRGEFLSTEPKKGYSLASGKTQRKRGQMYGGDIERYGALEGLYVQDDVWKVIKNGERHIRETEHALDGLMKTHRRLLNMVKHNKLIGNFSTQVHNILGIVQLMVAEGANPITFFKEYKNFRKGLDDPFFRELAASGLMPTAARGVGDVSDTMKAIKNVNSSRQFAKIMFDDFSSNIPSDGVIKSAISTGVKGAPELAMQLMETTSYKLFGMNGRMAKFFTATDRIARYGFFKQKLTKLAKKNKITPEQALKRKDLVEEAAQFSSDVMLDYTDLPTGIQAMRESGIAPYIAYPWRASMYFMKFPFKNPKTYQAMEGTRAAVEGLDTNTERMRRRSQFPGDIMYPMGDAARDIMNTGMRAIGQPEFEELNISPRYWSPVPKAPEEMYGLRSTSWSGDELVGSSGLTPLDDRSAIAQTTGLPIPDPMGWKPAMELARGEPLKAAAALAPGYASKITRDTLYGKDIPKRDLYLQSFAGLRTMPKEHRQHAFKTGKNAVKKLKGQPRMKDLSTRERMEKESSVLTRSTRGTLF